MKLVVPSEILENEHRVGITPDCVAPLVKMGFKVFVQSNAGINSSYSDEDYKKVGAKISSKLSELYSKAEIVVKIQRPVKNKKINEFSYLKNTNILLYYTNKNLRQNLMLEKT